MKRAYILSAAGGSYANFLSLLIGKDPNYGSLPLDYSKFLSSNNTFSARQLKLQEYFKKHSDGVTLPDLTAEFKRALYKYIEDKNIVLHTHYYRPGKIDLENLKKVRLQSKSNSLLIYFMFLAKVESRKVVVDKNLIDNWSVKNPRINFVIPDQEVTRLSLNAFLENMTVQDYLLELKKRFCKPIDPNEILGDWDHYDVDKIIFEPEKNAEDWQAYFDMLNPPDVNIIKNYRQENLNLVKKIFKVSYEEISSEPDSWQSPAFNFAIEYDTPVKIKN